MCRLYLTLKGQLRALFIFIWLYVNSSVEQHMTIYTYQLIDYLCKISEEHCRGMNMFARQRNQLHLKYCICNGKPMPSFSCWHVCIRNLKEHIWMARIALDFKRLSSLECTQIVDDRMRVMSKPSVPLRKSPISCGWQRSKPVAAS